MAKTKSIKFTQARLAALEPAEQDYTVNDTQQPGLLCRVRSSGLKTLEIRKRPAGSHKVVRVRICQVGELPLTGENSVQTRALEILSDLLKGHHPNERKRAVKARRKAKALTLGQALEDYFEATSGGERPMKDSTRARYEREVRVHFGDWTDRPLAELINKPTLQERHRKISRKHPTAANNAFRVLRAIAVFKREEMETNGESPIPSWPIISKASRRRFWNQDNIRDNWVRLDDLSTWWKTTERLPTDYAGDGELARDYLQFVLLTGLRRREASHKLVWENVDLRRKTFSIEDTKNRKTLELPLSDYQLEILRRRRAATGGKGEVFGIEEPKKFVRWVAEQSGVPFTIHDLRRSFASYCERLDFGLLTTKALLNHASGTGNDVTSNYVQIDTARLREPMQRVTNLVLNYAGVKPDNVVKGRFGT